MYRDALQIDPSARAAYSGNPGFTDGADEPHPISSPDESLLVRPEIAEALEAVYLREAPAEAAETNGNPAPLDFELARSGLGWLRRNIDGNAQRDLRQRVIEAKSGLEVMEYSQQLREANEQQAAEQERQRQARQETEAEARRAMELEWAREAARQAQYRAELDAALEPIRAAHPELDFDSFLGLCDEMEVMEEKPSDPDEDTSYIDYSDGGTGLYVRRKPGLRQKVSQRAVEYADPEALEHDLKVRQLLQASIRAEFRQGKFTALGAYSSIAFVSLHEALVGGFIYPRDFSEQTVEAWLDAVAADKPETGLPTVAPAIEPKPGYSNIKDFTIGVYGKNILTNSLDRILKEQPEKFIQAMYTVAEAGLDPEDEAKRIATTRILTSVLAEQPLATFVFHAASTSRNQSVQRKAIDVGATLRLIDPDVGGRLIENPQSIAASELSRDEKRRLLDIYNRYLKISRPLRRDDEMAFDQRQTEHIDAFLDWAKTPEGKSSTVYGRFTEE